MKIGKSSQGAHFIYTCDCQVLTISPLFPARDYHELHFSIFKSGIEVAHGVPHENPGPG
jgi:hypothetical protein